MSTKKLCEYCGADCARDDRGFFNEKFACDGLLDAWRSDEAYERECDSRASLRGEDFE